jgi:peptide/nickel transport system permease protein
MRDRRRSIGWAVGFLGLFHGAVLLAGFLAPYHFAEQHRDFPFAPPARIHFQDQDGRFHMRPSIYRLVQDLSTGGYREDPAQEYRLLFFLPVKPGEAAGLLPLRRRLFGVPEPGVIFLLGSDGFGRDEFSRVLYGGQVSLLTGLAAAFLSLGLGLILGTAAGFWGGWADRILMRTGELFLALPWLYLLLAARALLPLHIQPVQAFLLLVGIIGSVGWVRPARLIRGVVLSGKERGFVLAARGFGASAGYIVRRHILPMTFSVVLTQATVLIPQYILAEVTLSFLGLGVAEPVPSWGNLLAEARQYHTLVSHLWMLAPGLATVPVLLGYLKLADGLLESAQGKGVTHA